MVDPEAMASGGPIFIVGFPRSGTTLLRTLVSSHPEAALLPYETHLLDRWLPRLGNDGLSTASSFDAFWTEFIRQPGFDRTGLDPEHLRGSLAATSPRTVRAVFNELMRSYAASRGKSRRGEKTPDHHLHVATLLEWFADGRVLFMVRDPRAVLASWLSLDQPWARVPSTAIATRWRNGARSAIRWSDHPRVHTIRYEDLVTSPDDTLAEAFSFLDLGGPVDLASEGATAGHHGRYDPRGPVRGEALERWKTVLLGSELAFIELIAEPEMTRLGYSSAVDVTTADRTRAVATRLSTRAARGSRRMKRRAAAVVRRPG